MRHAIIIVLAAALASTVACKKPTNEGSPRETTSGIPPKPPEHPNASPEALERKARSEAKLKADRVTVNATLPVIESESEAKIRTRDAVVERAVALMIVAVKGEGLEQDGVLKNQEKLGAATFFSPKEKAFVANLRPTQSEKAQFGWEYECLGVMLWALGLEPELSRPDHIVDAAHVVKAVLDRGTAQLRADAKLRSPKELLDAADLIYRYDWTCVDARVSRKGAPKGVDCEVVVERHRALNWLIGYQGQEWDDVSTDT